MMIRLLTAILLLVTGLTFAHCGGSLIPPSDEVTTRMNDKDKRALKHADAGAKADATQEER